MQKSLILLVFCFQSAWAALPLTQPELVGMDRCRLAKIDETIAEALARKQIPGCVVCIGRRGKIVHFKAYGNRQLLPVLLPMTTDTVFDLASMTKPVATATSIMMLIERGQLRLSDTVCSFIPEFKVNDKATITVRDLLLHQSGLIGDNPLDDYEQGPEEAMKRIYNLSLETPVGTRYKYSDLNFILLAEIIKRVTGKLVNECARENIFKPMGMTETTFLPSANLRSRAAPTEWRNNNWIQGEVHDPRAYLLGGISGHAGLFSTARDLVLFAQMMLNGGMAGDKRILSKTTVARMTRGEKVPGAIRALGWDKLSPQSLNRADLLSERAFGHGGFTGNALWIDPEYDLFYLVLSNSVHPDGKELIYPIVYPLIARIGNIAIASICDRRQVSLTSEQSAELLGIDQRGNDSLATNSLMGSATLQTELHRVDLLCNDVLTGIDVLQRDNFRQLDGRRIGLITNHTGRNRDGVSVVTLLKKANNLTLVTLLSPEHGFTGASDLEEIPDTFDQGTGLRVYSLRVRGTTIRPTAEMLKGCDALVFDVQDIGTRFYTYLSAMGESMCAAAEHKRRFVVLDRPNPINGITVSGPMRDQDKGSVTAFHTIPIRHGMTAGEMARMIKAELKLDLELIVIACEGWQRRDYYDATGLTWINPSPNMRNLNQALLYPGIGLFEYTNLSVGRGTDTPFEIIGAPWLDGRKLASVLNRCKLPGVRFMPIEFTPTERIHAKTKCSGVSIIITDRSLFEPLRTSFEIAVQLKRLFPQWDAHAYGILLVNQKVLDALIAGKSAQEIDAIAREGMGEFLLRRSQYLLYE